MTPKAQPDVESVLTLLEDRLGTRLVSLLCGLRKEISLETTMAKPLSIEAEAKLRTGYTAFRAISETEGPDVARAWMIGMNPLLGDSSPIEEIAEGRGPEVLAAVRIYLEGSL